MPYDFSKVKADIVLTKEWILGRISDAQIFSYYHGPFKLGTVCKASLRVDNTPSASFFISNTGKILYHDFRGLTLDCFSYVKELYKYNFNQALWQIASDFGLLHPSTIKNQKVVENALKCGNDLDKEQCKQTLIQYTVKPWNDKNLQFWKLYEITQAELEQENIFAIDRLFVNKIEIKTNTFNPRYAKLELWTPDPNKPEFIRKGVKVYSPYDKDMKWLSSIPLDHPFGLDTLSYESNIVFITKSFKDLIIMKKVCKSVIATQNESEGALSDIVINMLDEMFDKKIIVFDNDVTGISASKKFNERGFGYFNIPNKERFQHKIKDPADYVKAYGVEALKDLLIEKNLFIK